MRWAWPPSSAPGRWSTLGPYYAMFPVPFARRTVEALCPPGGAVLDPFCGRGTTPYVARVTGRASLGIDCNAVAYVFAAAKTDPEPELSRVLQRVDEIGATVRPEDREPANAFQQLAWAPRVLAFLNAARRELDWRTSRLDRTLMALILVHLHAKPGNGVSNGMRQSKSMAPDYAVRWWSERGHRPPDLDPVAYFQERAAWRYRFGVPEGACAEIRLNDARVVLPASRRRFSFLLTSPPYCGVTHYRVDNWIRLWMLGEGALPTYGITERYSNRVSYAAMLREVFTAARRLLHADAAVYVRTDSRAFTCATTQELLAELWPQHNQFARAETPLRSQTSLFTRTAGARPGETDLLMLRPGMRPPEGFVSTEQLHALRARFAEA